MKYWFSLLLAIIVVASSVVPCCTVDDCQEQISGIANEEQPAEDSCVCSPFFACAFCSGFAHIALDIQVAQPEVKKTAHYEKFLISFTSIYCSDLFQPPRLVLYI